MMLGGLFGMALGSFIVGWMIVGMWWADYREISWYGMTVIFVSATIATLLGFTIYQ